MKHKSNKEMVYLQTNININENENEQVKKEVLTLFNSHIWLAPLST